MLRNRIVHHLLVGLLGAGVGIVASCQNEDTTSSCYPLSLWADVPASQAPDQGICRWGGDSFQPFPERDYGEDVELHTVGVLVETGSTDACDGCPGEEIDALLLHEIESRCDTPVLEFMRGCYYPLKDGLCSYTGLYWAACEVDSSGDIH